ncbi:MAG: glycosyltransferase [Candidatus Hydrogenedens sp.]|nr:glycosyltransferase [Candidatus Hydrogenedens sp.]
MNAPRLQVSERLQAMMTYPKFAGESPRILILESRYWLDDACMHACDRMGWSYARVGINAEGVMPREQLGELLMAVTEFRPDFIFTVNAAGMDEDGMLAALFADLHIPMVTWYVDDPRTILLGRDCYGSAYSIAVTWDEAYEDYLRARGYADAWTLPLAADTTVFDAEPAQDSPLPPAFVANSMEHFVARERAWLAEHPPVLAAIDAAFGAGRVHRDTFGAGLGAMAGEGAMESWDEHERRHAELYCFIEGTRRLRRALVEHLAPHGMVVRGDEAWGTITGNWGPYINYEQDMPAFYRQCAVNVNSTSIQMPNAVNQRVLDCPAAGGFLLTDNQPALRRMFDVDTETVVYSTLEEAAEKMQYYQTHPQARLEIVRRARARVLGEHTYEHRLRDLTARLKAFFGNG